MSCGADPGRTSQKRCRGRGAGTRGAPGPAGTGQRPVKRAWRRSAKLRRPSAASSLARSPGSSDAMHSRAASGPWPSPARALASVACTPRWACRATSWASSLARPTCAPVPGERSERPANAGERTGSRWSGPGRKSVVHGLDRRAPTATWLPPRARRVSPRAP